MNTNALKKEIDSWIEEYFAEKGTYERKIYEAMSYSVKNGGKRIRPILMLLTYKMYKEDYARILPFACALEMIHTYSLIHDDLPCMDDDDLRRGKPTNHKVFGEAIAVLAGDGLLNEAFKIMLKESLHSEGPEIKASYLIAEAASANGMIGGQVVDILSEDRTISIEELNFMHRKKTGELIKVALMAGGVLAKADKQELLMLEKFGENLGLVFQIIDDILDVEGSTEKLGKTVNSDLNNNKSTFVTLYGLEKCKTMAKELTEQSFDILHSMNVETSELEKLTLFLLEREY